MNGSTLIHAKDISQLEALAEDIDALDDIPHVSLDGLVTLDFEELCVGSGVCWAANQPVIFDEDSGLAVFQVNADAIRRVLTLKDKVDSERLSDLEKLDAFVRAYGDNDIYEMATF